MIVLDRAAPLDEAQWGFSQGKIKTSLNPSERTGTLNVYHSGSKSTQIDKL